MKKLVCLILFAATGAYAQTAEQPMQQQQISHGQAQQSGPQQQQVSPVEKLITVSAGGGYTSAKDQFFDICDIDMNGNMNILHHHGLKPEWTDTSSISERRYLKIIKLIYESRQGTMKGNYNNGSGDIPTFSVEAYPDNPNEAKSLEVANYASGTEEIDHPAARKLIRFASRICGLGQKRLEYKYIESRTWK